MMQMVSKLFEWAYETPLTSGATVTIQLGAESGINFLTAAGILRITWGIISSHTFDFTIDGCMDANFGAVDNLVTQNCLAATYYTPYQLPAAMAGDSIIITRPVIRIQIADTATANHTYTRIYLKAFWG